MEIGEVRVDRSEASAHIVAATERFPADVVMIGPSNRSPLMAFLGGRPSSRLFGALPCSLVCARRIPRLAGQEWSVVASDARLATPAT